MARAQGGGSGWVILIYSARNGRLVNAWAQDRLGPNRVGPWGIFQPLADGLKFLFKEEVIPSHVDKVFYMVAPAIALTTALLAFAVVPFGPTMPPPPLRDFRAGASGQPVWPQTKAELAAWVTRVRASGATRVWAYFNNDRDGRAIRNARELLRQLKSTAAGA